jgi:hypothetical protein
MNVSMISRLMAFRNVITVCYETHTKSVNIFCVQNAELLMAKQVVYIINSLVL